MKELYLVCPRCGISNTGWRTIESVYRSALWAIQNGDLVIVESEAKDSELIETSHECGFATDWCVDDFIIEVENGKVVYIGAYWRNHLEELKKIIDGRFEITEK